LKQPWARMDTWTKYSRLQLVIFLHSLLRVQRHLILWDKPMYFWSGPLRVFYESVCEEKSPTRACFGHPYQGGRKSLPLLLIYSHPTIIRTWVLFRLCFSHCYTLPLARASSRPPVLRTCSTPCYHPCRSNTIFIFIGNSDCLIIVLACSSIARRNRPSWSGRSRSHMVDSLGSWCSDC
jgi:hypothetical protein